MGHINQVVHIRVGDPPALVVVLAVEREPHFVIVVLGFVSENQSLFSTIDIEIRGGNPALLIEHEVKPAAPSAVEAGKEKPRTLLIKN